MPIRIIIVDDSRVVRGVLRAVLKHFADLEVVGEAADGKRAEQLIKELRPDVVTMDLLMPMKGGIEAIQAIMRDAPTPILVVADLDRADGEVAQEALAIGAVAVYLKPRGGFDDAAARGLAESVRAAAQQLVSRPQRSARRSPRPLPRKGSVRIVGIVSSTGGPRLLRAMLQELPGDLPCGIAVVQHTIVGSTEPLADWLSRTTKQPVAVARDGQQILPGHVVIAPDDAHLTIDIGLNVVLDRGPRIDSHRPSGTVLFNSLAANFRSQALGIVLSGMGNDGAEGAAALEAAGGSVLIVDPESAVIDGMPAAALARTHSAIVEPPENLAAALLRILGIPAP